ncbi:MAG: allophanate hydrolase [Ilumatobacteraceae bacterium]
MSRCAPGRVRDAAALAAVDPATLPLFGVPYVVKDNVDVAGEPTTAGCPGYTYVAERDATVVAKLQAAGAIVVGKTNLDQFATGLVGTRSPYGSPPNALDPDLVPGGSSSGSAVAVALGAVPFSIGTDTAGSGRVPAALNGIVGFKPTVGRVSTAGVVPAVRRLDCPSVFARSVADARLVAEAIAGPDAADALSRPPAAVRPMRWPPRVGIPSRWPDVVDAELRRQFDAAVERLAGLGASIVTVDLDPALQLGAMLYGSALVAERATAVGDAVRAGIAGLDPTVAGIIGDAAAWTATDAYAAEYRLADLRAEAATLWREVDVLTTPATPILPTRAAVAADPLGVNRTLGLFSTFVNLIGATAVVVPCEPGRPGGLQLVAEAWHDDELAALAGAYVAGTLGPPPAAHTVVVVGAHLSGLPLNGQLTALGAWLRDTTTTAPRYRLHALPGTVPPKPGLRRVTDGGAAVEVEVWSIGAGELGAFVAGVPAPLGIGSIELADGSWHHGFICEGWALDGAEDVTEFGGWRAYLAARPTRAT